MKLEKSYYITYLHILNHSLLDLKDITNIYHFYNAMVIYSALGMLSEEAKVVALEEIKNYIGEFLNVKEIREIYINAYYELFDSHKKLIKSK